MSMVKFAKVCDACATRGPEYDAAFALKCRECGGDFCDKCRDALADAEADVDHAPDSVCVQCAVELQAGAGREA
jgi:hypothetical protein